MKVFIAGARSIKELDCATKEKLISIYNKGYDVLIGDCYGVDTSVQKVFADLHYSKVTIYASDGHARNNVGRWNVHAVIVPSNVYGFNFYRQKDIAMANDANYGFMVWDGKSQGTFKNIVSLSQMNKPTIVSLPLKNKMYIINGLAGIENLLSACHLKSEISHEFALQTM